MLIELNDYELDIIISVMRLQRVMLSPVPSNDIERNLLMKIEYKLSKYLKK